MAPKNAAGSRLASQMATSTGDDDDAVVCEGEKTREERDRELRAEAVSIDD